MATSYYVVCHDCKKRIPDTELLTSGYVDVLAKNWHRGHNKQILLDVLGWDNEYDRLFESSMDYDEEIAKEDYE